MIVRVFTVELSTSQTWRCHIIVTYLNSNRVFTAKSFGVKKFRIFKVFSTVFFFSNQDHDAVCLSDYCDIHVFHCDISLAMVPNFWDTALCL